VSRRRGGDDHRGDDAVNSPLEDTVGNRRTLVGDTPYSVGYRPTLCENSDLSIVRENPTAQNGSQSTIGTSGDILQLPKTRSVGVFTQPGPEAVIPVPA